LSRLATSAGGAASLRDRALDLYDGKGTRVGELALEKKGDAVARFGDEWLVRVEKQKALTRLADGEKAAAFATGKTAIGAFAVGRDDTVAVTRGDSLELWSRDDVKKWSAKGGPFLEVAIARDHVVALSEEGPLVFLARDKGTATGALRLASTDPTETWRLAHIDGEIVVLALGEWLVWIDATTRKTVRRVRAQSKVQALAADADLVVAAVEDGLVQTFRASSGEPRASFTADPNGVFALALTGQTLFTLGSADEVRAQGRETLDVAVKAAAPVASVFAKGSLAVAGDKSGKVRVFETHHGELREVGTLSVGDSAPGEPGAVGVFLGKTDTVVAAGSRGIMTAPSPWNMPKPTALRGAPTAFAADDGYAFAGSTTGAVEVYDLTHGRHVTTYALSSDDRITALTKLPGATLVVGTGALDGRVLIVDVAESKVVHRISPHEEAFGVTCLAADARGRIVASGSDDGTIVLLDPAKGRVLARIRVKETPMKLAFEPTGRRLAAAFADGTAAVVTFTQKGATVADLGLRGASHVAWGDSLIIGFKDGRIECGDRHAPPSERPAARQ
jgi:WD40 repeat protein